MTRCALLTGVQTCALPIFLTHDLGTKEGVEAAARDISGRASAVHILINNAGIFTAGNVEDVKADQWDRELGLNLRAPFFLVQALLPKLKAASQPGDPARVINLGSIGALWGRSSNVARPVRRRAGKECVKK